MATESTRNHASSLTNKTMHQSINQSINSSSDLLSVQSQVPSSLALLTLRCSSSSSSGVTGMLPAEGSRSLLLELRLPASGWGETESAPDPPRGDHEDCSGNLPAAGGAPRKSDLVDSGGGPDCSASWSWSRPDSRSCSQMARIAAAAVDAAFGLR